MTIKCPGCNANFNVPPRLYGKNAKCSQCGMSISIPFPAKSSGNSNSVLIALLAVLVLGIVGIGGYLAYTFLSSNNMEQKDLPAQGMASGDMNNDMETGEEPEGVDEGNERGHAEHAANPPDEGVDESAESEAPPSPAPAPAPPTPKPMEQQPPPPAKSDELLVREAFARELNLPLNQVFIDIDTNTGNHMDGMIGINVHPKDVADPSEAAEAGGDIAAFMAAKVNGKWVAVWSGQGIESCDIFRPYNFPKSMMEYGVNCVN